MEKYEYEIDEKDRAVDISKEIKRIREAEEKQKKEEINHEDEQM